MTLNKLAKEICLREGKKKQVNIAQVKEIIGVISDIWYAEVIENDWHIDKTSKNCTDVALFLNGEKRAKKKAAKLKRGKK